MLCLVLQIVVWYFVLRYNTHMLQQNTYLNNEHAVWLRKNWMRQDVLILDAALVALAVATGNVVLLVLAFAALLFSLYYFVFLKRYLSKKPLVFTARVKRLVATDALLSFAPAVVCYVLHSLEAAVVCFGVVTMLQPLVVMLANVVNFPIEHAIHRYYINDAKSMLAQNPELVIIGITGSFGKTSMKHYLTTLLQSSYNVLMTPGNFNTPLGVARTVRTSLKPTDEVFVCEMGARYVGEIAELCEMVHPHHGVITALGPQHLETFGSIPNIVKTKFELADSLPADGKLFLNFDNELIAEHAQSYDSFVSYGTEDGTSYHAADISLSSHGTSFTLVAPSGETERFDMRLVGKHNVANVVGALAVAHQMGIALSKLKTPVRRIQPVEHRMQMHNDGWATIIDDAYNSNPVGAHAAVETLSMFDGTRVLITPGMVELGDEQGRYNFEFGRYAATCCDYALVVGSTNRDALQKGLLEGGMPQGKLRLFTHVEDALAFAGTIDDGKHKFILLENDLPDMY